MSKIEEIEDLREGIHLEVCEGKVVRKDYTGKEDILIFKKGIGVSREDIITRGNKNAFMMLINLMTSIVFVLLMDGLLFNILGVISIILLIMSVKDMCKSIKLLENLQSQDSYYEETDDIEVGEIYGISTDDNGYNDIVRLEDGKILRVYQLIDDKNILDLTISHEEELNTEMPISLGDDKFDKIIKESIDDKDLGIEDKVIYDIGNTIPKISAEDMESILNSIEEVYRYKVTEDRNKLYEKEYKKAMLNNRGMENTLPLLTNSQEYLGEELSNIKTKLKQELNNNKEFVKEYKKGVKFWRL